MHEHDLGAHFQGDTLRPASVTVQGLRRLLLGHLVVARGLSADVDRLEDFGFSGECEEVLVVDLLDLIPAGVSEWSAYTVQ